MNSVHSNGFSVGIVTDKGPVEKIIYRKGNYYALADNTEYKITLGNAHDVKTDAHVWVNGVKAGIWRINPYSKVIISASSDFKKKFRITENNQYDQYIDRTLDGNINNGLIRVLFYPEIRGSYQLELLYNYDAFKRDDPTIDRFAYCKNYTDSISPENLNRHCSTPAYIYEQSILMNNTPIYANSSNIQMNENTNLLYDVSPYTSKVKDKNRYIKAKPLDRIDYDQVTNIYIRLVVDNDLPTDSRKFALTRREVDSSIPPPKLDITHPDRPDTSCNSASCDKSNASSTNAESNKCTGLSRTFYFNDEIGIKNQ